MADDIKELVAQLRDPARVYTIPGDEMAAKKIADLLDTSAERKVPMSSVDVLKATAVKILNASRLAH